MKLALRLARKALPVFAFAIIVAACSRGEDKPPEPAKQADEVVVIASGRTPDVPTPAQTPTDFETAFPAEEVNEDPTDKPSLDLAQNPADLVPTAEAPHPNRPVGASSVGLGGPHVGGGVGGSSPAINGGIGGGGGRGGVAYRRARGGGDAEPVETVVAGTSDTPGGMTAQAGGETLGAFPLKSTEVKCRVTGSLAATRVTQTFTNPYKQAMEAVYTFPLPADAAVNEFVMTAGKRRIIGIVRPRGEAEQAYKEARARGYTATLMTQERPNVFTQNVANIAVNEQVAVTFTFFQMLSYREGQFKWAFPLTIGPRYTPPGQPTPDREPDVGMKGTAAPNERVPDAPAVTPPTLPPGVRSGQDVRIEVELAPGLPIDLSRLQSVAHEVESTMTSDGRVVVSLKPADRIANRDFVLRWAVMGKQPQAAVWTHDGRYLCMQLQPQLDPADADVTPREITFLLDVSGSMSGTPIAASKALIKRVLQRLRPEDKFNIVKFASGNEALFDAPVEADDLNLTRALAFIDAARTGGGTNMMEAFKSALGMPKDKRYLGVYAFLTDGYISNEREIHALCAEHAGHSRSFAFGIGSAVNRHLCDGIAAHGLGKAIYYVGRDEDGGLRAADEFFTSIDSPVLCDVHVDWGGLTVEDAAVPRDLFAGEPLTISAHITGKGKHKVTVSGRVGGRAVAQTIEVDLDGAGTNPAVAALWARRKVDALTTALLTDPENSALVQQITQVGVAHNLVTKYTAFLAVDESRVNSDGNPLRVLVPCEMPEGVNFSSAEQQGAKVASIETWGMTLAEVDGKVHVVAIADGSPAAKMGMVPGQRLLRVNGAEVTSLEQVERLLLQGDRNPVLQTRVTDEGRNIDAEFTLPDPVKVGPARPAPQPDPKPSRTGNK